MIGNKVCIDCPSSLICNFGTGTERGHIYVCADCGAADFVMEANDLREIFLRKTGHAMGVKHHTDQLTFRIPAECPMLATKGSIREYIPAGGEEQPNEPHVFRPVMYVCADCFNGVYGSEDEEARMASVFHKRNLDAIYKWMHGSSKKERVS